MSFLRSKLLAGTFVVFCLFAMMHQIGGVSVFDLDVKADSGLTSYRAIDLYTNKEPFNGKGLNQPSDAFAPQEEVILYACVTYRGDPVMGKIVAFEVNGPRNRFENLSFTHTAITDENGIANTSFIVTWPNGHPKDAVFGVWKAIAVVDIAGVAVNDTISFTVGWIIELVKIKTVDMNNISKSVFVKNEQMGFRLTVKNIAMTEMTATLIVDVYDNIGFHIGQIVLQDEKIAPGITVLFIKGITVPVWASLGEGNVYANAYTALPTLGGVPYCPYVSTKFSIVKFVLHDVAVINVFPSIDEAFVGDVVNVSVVVRNEGDFVETFNVDVYYDSALIGTETVANLPPKMEKTLNFAWSTSCLSPGNYTLSASADVVPEEIDVKDNRFVDGVVWLKSVGPIPPPSPVECLVPRWLLVFLFLIAVLLGGILVILVGFVLWSMHKRKEKKETEPQTTPVVSNKRSFSDRWKKCDVCGKEFPSAYTFCPYCLSFHGKDYE